MILVRDIFNLKFGKAKEARSLLQEAMNVNTKLGLPISRVMSDLTGKSYTLVMESEFESLSKYEVALSSVFKDEGWQTSYQKFVPLVDSASREIYTVHQ